MKVDISGLTGWTELFATFIQRLQIETFSKELASLMVRFVHVRTGNLKRSIYYYSDKVGARANYASVELDRGGEHDFVSRALKAFDLNRTVTGELNGLY